MVHHRPDFERVTRAIDPASEADERAALLALQSEDAERSFTNSEIIDILEQTRSNRLRNAAALVLADRQSPGLAQRLSVLLTSPDLAKAAGTLLYALDRVDGMLPGDAFLNLIKNGSYEARAEALACLAENRIVLAGPEEAKAVASKLFAFTQSDDAGTVEAAGEALEHWHPSPLV